MRLAHFLLFFALTAAGVAHAEDMRPLAPLPPAAQESMRQEMLENLAALNEVLSLFGSGKLREAGEVAEAKLGVASMGKHRAKPMDARPGPHMPQAMHSIGMDGHKAVSEFANAAKAGERDKAMALLPNLTGACVGCHFSYRTR